MARAQNVDAIDLDGIDHANGPSDFGVGHQLRINFLPQVRHELLGIVQAAMTEFFRKNSCSGHNRTRQRPAASFINPGNPRDAGSAEFFLITKSAAPAHAAYYAEILMVRSEMRLVAKSPITLTSHIFTRAQLSLPCPCECEDNLVWRDVRGLFAPLLPLQCAANAAEINAQRLLRRRFGA